MGMSELAAFSDFESKNTYCTAGQIIQGYRLSRDKREKDRCKRSEFRTVHI